MKAAELMIGDLVYIHEPECKGHRIDAIDELYGQVGADGEVYDECDIRQIPITEEILVKNGFHTYGESYFIPEDECNAHVRIGFHKRETVVDLHRHGAFSIQISCKPGKLYVHQLQHALRLCGIEKEIVID